MRIVHPQSAELARGRRDPGNPFPLFCAESLHLNEEVEYKRAWPGKISACDIFENMAHTHETPCTGSLFGGLTVTKKQKQQTVVTVKVKNRGTIISMLSHASREWRLDAGESESQTHARHQFQQ